MKTTKIAIIGLGYVGLPLTRLIATQYTAIGFYLNERRVNELQSGKDSTPEVENEVLQSLMQNTPQMSKGLFFTTNLSDIQDCNYFIATVPTPVERINRPILTPLYKASESIGSVLEKGDIVAYESTVYSGVN